MFADVLITEFSVDVSGVFTVRRKLLGLGVVFPLLGPLLSLTLRLMQLDPVSATAFVGDLLIDGE